MIKHWEWLTFGEQIAFQKWDEIVKQKQKELKFYQMRRRRLMMRANQRASRDALRRAE